MRTFRNISNEKEFKELNDFMQNPQRKLFIFIHMNGCYHCMTTEPQWFPLYKYFNKKKYNKYSNYAIADIEHSYLSKLNFIKFDIDGYPCMKIIYHKGNKYKSYEDDNFDDRKTKTFIQWVLLNFDKNKTNNKNNKTNNKNKKTKKTNKNNKTNKNKN